MNFKDWFDLAQTVLIAIIGIQNYLSKKQAATIASIEKLEDDVCAKINDHNARIAKAETFIEQSMTAQDFRTIHKRIDDFLDKIGPIEGQSKRLEGQLSEMSKTIDRLDHHLMQILNKG